MLFGFSAPSGAYNNMDKGRKTIMVDVKKIALFVGGVVFGSAGFKLLSSSDAKKVYTQTTAAVLRMKDSTMRPSTRSRSRPVTSWPTQRPSTRPAPPRQRPPSSRTKPQRLLPPRTLNNF